MVPILLALVVRRSMFPQKYLVPLPKRGSQIPLGRPCLIKRWGPRSHARNDIRGGQKELRVYSQVHRRCGQLSCRLTVSLSGNPFPHAGSNGAAQAGSSTSWILGTLAEQLSHLTQGSYEKPHCHINSCNLRCRYFPFSRMLQRPRTEQPPSETNVSCEPRVSA